MHFLDYCILNECVLLEICPITILVECILALYSVFGRCAAAAVFMTDRRTDENVEHFPQVALVALLCFL